MILKQRKYPSPRSHTIALPTENIFRLVLIFIFRFPIVTENFERGSEISWAEVNMLMIESRGPSHF